MFSVIQKLNFRSPARPCECLVVEKMTVAQMFYVVGSKSFRPDHLFKVTEIKQLCYFSTQSLPLFQHTFHICELVTHRWHYISLTEFSIWRGFCMSDRKLLDPTTYTREQCYKKFSPKYSN